MSGVCGWCVHGRVVGWVVCLWWWGGWFGVLVRSEVEWWWCVGWICKTHIWSLTLFPRGILIFQGVLTELTFLTKFDQNERLKI